MIAASRDELTGVEPRRRAATDEDRVDLLRLPRADSISRSSAAR